MKRGEIWIGNLNPARGVEFGKFCPVLIIQTDALTATATGTVVVLPLTSRKNADISLYRIPIAARGKLRKNCWVVVSNPRTLDRHRLGEGPLARLTNEEMGRIERSLLAVLGMYR